MTERTYSFFSIDCYHEGTGMVIHEVYLDSVEPNELPQFLQEKIRQLEANQVVPLDSARLMEFAPLRAELCRWGNLPIRLRHEACVLPYRVHGGRELDMMTKGLKPLAAFSHPPASLSSFLNEYFDPLVACGKFISDRIYEGEDDDAGIGAIILYALPSEAWRIEAYRLMNSTAEVTNWNDTLERMQGSLLGYTKEQNDLWIEYRRRKGCRWGLQTMYRFVTDTEVNQIREAGYKAFPVSDHNTVRLYQPHYGQGEPISALTVLRRMALARICAPKIKLMEFSKGVTRISDTDFDVFELSGSDVIKLNELIDGAIDIMQLPE